MKSDRVRNFPPRGPRKNPPPKPIPYQLHKGYKETGLLKTTGPPTSPPEPGKKPEPAPRKISSPGQKNTTVHCSVPQRPIKGYVKINNGNDEDPLSGPQGKAVESRPRLDTPQSPPDPDMVANGVRSPPVPPMRVGVAAPGKMPAELHGRRNASGPQPMPRPTGKERARKKEEEEEKMEEEDEEEWKKLYFEAYGHTQERKEEEDGEMYATVMDAPRRIVSPGSSHSVTPPIPLPRSPPTIPAPSEDYSVTTHVVIQVRGNLPPKPTPVDSYSVLDRPDKPNRVLSPPDPDAAPMYSSLEVEGSPPPPPIPPRGVAKDGPEEGYSHLEFSGVAQTDQDIVREHYEMSEGYGGEGGKKEAESSDLCMYETVSPQDSEDSHAHEASSLTRSAPPEGTGTKMDGEPPRVIARQASQKNKERKRLQASRDRSSMEAYHNEPNGTVEGVGHVIGVVKLAPAPPPKRWKKPKSEPFEGQEVETRPRAGEDRGEMPVEDFYSIPPDAEALVSQGEDGMGTIVLEPTDDKTLEEAGYQTWRTFSPAEDDTSFEGSSEQQQLEGGMQKEVNGRESRSSLMSECLAELQNLHSSSPLALVSIDRLRLEKEREELERGRGGDQERGSEGADTRGAKPARQWTSSYENQDMQLGTDSEQWSNGRGRGGWRGRPFSGEGGGERDEQREEEDLSQYDLQTVQHPALVPDSQGYCEVELQLSPTGLAHEAEAKMHVVAVEGAVPVDDLTNYDLQTVLHPQVLTSTQGYSYCDIGISGPGDWKPVPSKREIPTAASCNETTPPSLSFPGTSIGYTEIDIPSPTTGRPPPTPPSDRQPPTPKPRKGRLNSRDDSISNETILDALHEIGPQEDQAKNVEANGDQPEGFPGRQDGDVPGMDLSEGNAVYAKVMDIKSRKHTAKKKTASPKPSPKMNRKGAGTNGEKASPKVTKKPRGPPRRQPPPPPPPGMAPVVPPSGMAHGPPPPTSSSSSSPTGEEKARSKAEMIKELEQSLPSLPLQQRSPACKGVHAIASDLTSFPGLADKGKPLGSPKLPNRGPAPPSPPQPQPEPGSPLQKKSIFSRVKSHSLRNHKAECTGTTSPLADEMGFEKSMERSQRVERKTESSPKPRWKLRFRRTNSNGTTNDTENNDGGGKNERKRRNREDKLPDVPDDPRTMSLPAAARQKGLTGVHKHEGMDLEEEEDEFGIYSVVGGGSSPQVKKVSC